MKKNVFVKMKVFCLQNYSNFVGLLPVNQLTGKNENKYFRIKFRYTMEKTLGDIFYRIRAMIMSRVGSFKKYLKF